ncbi:ABC transporter substrate-binding protein [Microbacterium saperdae]|uniref:Carbohydrate ABC transporter substrate-binding protein (CUT1 family) n=1 Tax=Microbacterium saperdae TaxID=69368 RepID=A0A543BLE3_9MICO|nr:extracellular solute-binding protein [Microbacterium saperdae]TQL85628.1 carbohydrate ABC transporter substrate-binding protein (CUT1 family) [Microbacterium saperdae]GGM62110.1 sugar ABC transporter substrate-binding protein [Microbacterium saperdae]
MFRSTPRRLASLGGITIAALLMTACVGGTAPSSGDTELVTDPSEISGEITFSTWWAYADQELIDGFSKKYPNVTVNLDFTAVDSYATKMQTLASSGDLPDVFAVQGPTLVALADADQLLDLDDALATPDYDDTADSDWGSTFIPSLLAGANSGIKADGTWGVPFTAISVASLYNKDVFDEVGVTPPASFDDLLSNCRALSSAGYIPMSLTGAAWINWWAMLAQDQTMQGESEDDFDVSNPSYIRSFEIIQEMAEADCWTDSQITTDIAAETALFLQGKTAQFITVPENFLKSVSEGASFELGSYVLPALDGKTPNRTIGGGGANVLAVSASSDNQSAAVAFAKYLTSPEVQTSLAASEFTIPSTDVDVAAASPLMTAYLEAAANGFADEAAMPSFTTAGATTYNTEILPNLILGKITPEEAAQATAGLFVTE